LPAISFRKVILKGFIAKTGLSAFSHNAISAITKPSATSSATSSATLSTTEGPYYPNSSMRLADVNNNVVNVSGIVKKARGEIILRKVEH